MSVYQIVPLSHLSIPHTPIPYLSMINNASHPRRGTKEELRSTGVRLQETEASLVATEHARNAQKFLVQHHVEIEDTLLSQAQQVCGHQRTME